ncbi:MAG: CBS domain-containing protein [Deltaproteobacteria bacterium]|nr:CBS domain-containing protein [Deltaproteobacteria bacterium]
MLASKMMSTDIITLTIHDTLDDALKLLYDVKVRVLPIVDDEKKLAGVISPRLLLRRVLPGYISKGYLKDVAFAPDLSQFMENIEKLNECKIGDFLEKPCCLITPETSAMEVAAIFVNADPPLESIIVVDDEKRILGLISPVDIFKRLWEFNNKQTTP